MSLALLEDLIAVEDVADLAECGALLAWLERLGLLDASRVRACGCCGRPFVRARRTHNQRYCSVRCRGRVERRVYAERYPGRPQLLRRESYRRAKAGRAHQGEAA